MADRVQYFFRQRVSEQELNLASELLEKADRNLAADLGVFGIVSGAVPAPHQPVPNLSIDFTAPARAYDHLGQRIFFGTGQTVGVARDVSGVSTDVMSPASERWLAVFLRFDRLLSDERTDGNNQRVFFRQDESFEIVVRQGAEAQAGQAVRVPLQEDELLLCDVKRVGGTDRVLPEHIDVSRRQAFVFARGDSVGVFTELWRILKPGVPQLQATLDDIDALFARHFAGEARRHRSRDIDHTPSGFVTAATVQGAIDETASKLSSAADGAPGAALVGADAVVGLPRALAAGSVDAQLSTLLGYLNAHLSAASAAHNAAAIRALPHNWLVSESVQAQLQELVQGLRADRIAASAYRSLTTTNVQAQLRELLDDFAANSDTEGTALIGGASLGGSPRGVGAGTLLVQLREVVKELNAHLGSGDHDGRYARRVFLQTQNVEPNTTFDFDVLNTVPDVLIYSYDTFNQDFTNAKRWFNGPYTPNIRVWFDKLAGNQSVRIHVQNRNSLALFITVYGYEVG